jgi:precorrin-6Y C5,15-methyltransferase (decarboxylating)
MSVHPLIVAGIGHEGRAGLCAETRNHVETARVLAGGRRQLEFFPAWQGDRIVLDGDVKAFVQTLRDRYRRDKTVVLASGDPLFYGIGRALLDTIPRHDLVFIPHVSSVQLAFARVKEAWHDARVLSAHGRTMDALQAAVVLREPKIAVLTDSVNDPAAVARLLHANGADDEYLLWICENLGGPDERVSCCAPAEVCAGAFSPLNVVILLRKAQGSAFDGEESRPHHLSAEGPLVPVLGISESVLLDSPDSDGRGMITRREVRLLALCYLELRATDVLWDVGAGTGSVSIEAARLSAHLDIHAVERDAAAFARLQANVARFGAGRVNAVCGEAPDALAGLPDPDAVFVGGSGGKLPDILRAAVARLRPSGRLVVTCITLENSSSGWQMLAELGLAPEATTVQLAHSRPLGRLHCMEPEHPITILRGRKP